MMIPALELAAAAYTAPLPRAEARRLIRAAQRGDRAALETLVAANVRLVLKEVNRYQLRSALLDRDDLISEGVIGLCRAIEKFDTRRPVALSTYAVYWIRQRIARAVATTSGDLRLPAHTADAARRLYRAGDELSDDELQRTAGLTRRMLKLIRALPAEFRSFDEPITEDGDRDLGDVIPDPAVYDGDRIDRALLRDWLAEHISSPRGGQMLVMYYGLHPAYPGGLTMEAVGRRFGLSCERVRQYIAAAVRELKHPARAGRLRELITGDQR